MTNLGGAFVLPDLSSAFGELEAFSGEICLPCVGACDGEMSFLCMESQTGHVVLGDALPSIDSDVQPLAMHVEPSGMFELPCFDSQQEMPSQSGETPCTCLPEVDAQIPLQEKQRATRKRKPPAPRPSYLRCDAENDLGQISSKYGADLVQVPVEWLDMQKAFSLLTSLNILVWTVSGIGQGLKLSSSVFLLEIFAGCGNLTRAATEAGFSCGPSIDIIPAFGGGHVFDLRTPAGRQLVWALIVVLKPMWIHCGFPCTFWSTLAHCTRTRDEVINERTRLEELVYIFSPSRLLYGKRMLAAM